MAKFPATIYRFYTKDEVQGLLEEAGFGDVHVECQRIGSKELAFAIAHRETLTRLR
ncbi:MAG: hypothetical protein AB7G75_09555 [Candidatus Binatia bacterium]